MDEKLALWCKEQEIEALATAREGRDVHYKSYWSGKASAFADVWERIVFSGNRAPTPQQYNTANLEWSERAEEVK